jgi:hypothetical protein
MYIFVIVSLVCNAFGSHLLSPLSKVQECPIDSGHFDAREKRLDVHRSSTSSSTSTSVLSSRTSTGAPPAPTPERDEKVSLASISSFVVLPSGNEALIKQYVDRVGPVTVLMMLLCSALLCAGMR